MKAKCKNCMDYDKFKGECGIRYVVTVLKEGTKRLPLKVKPNDGCGVFIPK